MGNMEIREVPIGLMRDPLVPQRVAVNDADMPRLVESIQACGILQALGVRQVDGEFEVVWGHRRLQAARLAGLSRVPVVVVGAEDMELERLKWTENRERRDVGDLEEALWMGALANRHKLSQSELAAALGVSASYVSQRLAILSWPQDFQEALAAKAVSYSVLRELVRIKDVGVRDEYLRFAIEQGCTQRSAERWYREWLSNEEYLRKRDGGEENEAEDINESPKMECCSVCLCEYPLVAVQWMPCCEACACGIRGYARSVSGGDEGDRSTSQSATP